MHAEKKDFGLLKFIIESMFCIFFAWVIIQYFFSWFSNYSQLKSSKKDLTNFLSKNYAKHCFSCELTQLHRMQKMKIRLIWNYCIKLVSNEEIVRDVIATSISSFIDCKTLFFILFIKEVFSTFIKCKMSWSMQIYTDESSNGWGTGSEVGRVNIIHPICLIFLAKQPSVCPSPSGALYSISIPLSFQGTKWFWIIELTFWVLSQA